MTFPSASLSKTQLTADAAILLFTWSLLAIAFLFPQKVSAHPGEMLLLLAVAVSYPVASLLTYLAKNESVSTLLRTMLIMSTLSFLFGAVAPFQHVLFDGWMDAILISWDKALTGVEASSFLQHFANPALTEWMMFAYVIYVPLLPLVSIICYRSAGAKAANEYLVTLSLVDIACFAGFIFFPVAGPMFFIPEAFIKPLEGGIFTFMGEWMRTNLHYPGGCLPSPHCASATVMIVMMYRHNRVLFWSLLPIVLTLYVSTVYGRYHYSWDGIAGILLSLLVLKYSNRVVATTGKLINWMGKLAELHRRKIEPRLTWKEDVP